MEGVINGKTRICNAGKGRHDERKATVEWETRQFGIMDWITNDVDWMTGEWHPACRRLAWHN